MRPKMLVLALSLLAPTVSAQSISVGFKAGSNWAHQVGWCCGEENPYDARQGVTLGGTATLQLLGPLGVQAEVLYAGKGVQGGKEFRMRLNYLEFPVLVRFQPLAHLPVLPVLLLGMAPALELSCTGITRPPSIPESPAALQPLDCASYRTSKSDLSLVAAAGMDVNIGRVSFTAELRQTHGIRNLTADWPFALRTTNRATAVMLGARLR